MMTQQLSILLLFLCVTPATAADIEPLLLQGDIEAQVKQLSKPDRIRFGKHLAIVHCKLCHHKLFTEQPFFENDQYLRDSLLAHPKNFLAVKIRSKMRRMQMPPDELPKLQKFQWKPVHEYVRFIEKKARKQASK